MEKTVEAWAREKRTSKWDFAGAKAHTYEPDYQGKRWAVGTLVTEEQYDATVAAFRAITAR